MSRFSHYERCPKCSERGGDSRGDNLGVWLDGGSHCFSCGYHRSPTSLGKHRSDSRIEHVPKSLLPFDFTREVPTHAWKWLLQYGLPFSYWKDCCGYSPNDERLVFLVGNPLAFSIGRYVGNREEVRQGERPSLRNEDVASSPPRKWYVWGDSHKHCEVVNPGTGKKVALVEDLISAHKVAAAGTTCIPLFGTRIHPGHLWELQVDHRPVVLWLDKDQEQPVKKQAAWLQLMLGRPVEVVTTQDDPKKLSQEKIINALYS